MTATYWEIGRRILMFEQGGEHRAEYGEQLIEQLSGDLTRQFGRVLGEQIFGKCARFYLDWPQGQILQTLSGESSPPSDGSYFTLSRTSLIRVLASEHRYGLCGHSQR